MSMFGIPKNRYFFLSSNFMLFIIKWVVQSNDWALTFSVFEVDEYDIWMDLKESFEIYYHQKISCQESNISFESEWICWQFIVRMEETMAGEHK